MIIVFHGKNNDMEETIKDLMNQKGLDGFAVYGNMWIAPLGHTNARPKGWHILLWPFKGYYRHKYELRYVLLDNDTLYFRVKEYIYDYNYQTENFGETDYTFDEFNRLLDETPWAKRYATGIFDEIVSELKSYTKAEALKQQKEVERLVKGLENSDAIIKKKYFDKGFGLPKPR